MGHLVLMSAACTVHVQYMFMAMTAEARYLDMGHLVLIHGQNITVSELPKRSQDTCCE